MSSYNLLAQLFAEASLPSTAYNALPTAPVLPHVERRHRLRVATPALRDRFARSATPMNHAECAPAA